MNFLLRTEAMVKSHSYLPPSQTRQLSRCFRLEHMRPRVVQKSARNNAHNVLLPISSLQ